MILKFVLKKIRKHRRHLSGLREARPLKNLRPSGTLFSSTRRRKLCHISREQCFSCFGVFPVKACSTTTDGQELTVHAVTQAIVSSQEEREGGTALATGITIYVEPAKFSPIRLSHTVPRWLVDGLKTYFLEARPHIQPKEVLENFTMVFADDIRTVNTHRFFVNRKVSTQFKVRQLCDQFKDTVRT